MGSLHRHLQLQGPEHDRLAFRPDCPKCQTRLSGRYPEACLFSTRQGAAVATGLAATWALLPAGGALAGHKPHWLSAPTPAAPPAVVTDADGGGSPPLQDRHRQPSSSLPTAPKPPAAAAPPKVEVEVPRSEPSEAAPKPAEQAPTQPAPPERVPTSEKRAPSSEPDAAPPNETPDEPSPAPQTPAAARDSARDRPPGESHGQRQAHDRAEAHGPTEAPVGQQQAFRTHARGAGGARRDESRKRANPVAAERISDRVHGAPTHVVQPGECLWMIAERLLGEHPSDAQVAVEVDRLWQLNADRIATGNPDLIYPGQKLRLT